MAEKNLDILIRTMQPSRGPVCSFCQLTESELRSLQFIPLATFRELEGITVIVEQDVAATRGLKSVWTGVQITLNVNSSLDAVGFLARITAVLAEQCISVNAFSPVSHDHLFVRPEDADKTMELLLALQSKPS